MILLFPKHILTFISKYNAMTKQQLISGFYLNSKFGLFTILTFSIQV